MNSERIEYLVERYLSDLLTDEEKAELTKWLDENSEHRSLFRGTVELEFNLGSYLREEEQEDGAKLVELRESKLPSRLRNLEHVGFAALLMLCLGLGWRLWSETNRPAGNESSVAVLTQVSDDVEFREDHELPREVGGLVGKGWILLERGSVGIKFNSGAQVEVTGPAVFGIDTAMRGFLESGEVNVYAPEEARDFVIGTAQMEVVDLGTRFQVSAGPNAEAVVEVTEGLVDLHLGGEGASRRIQSLPAGLQARVNDVGEVLSIDGNPLDAGGNEGVGLLAHWTLDEVREGSVIVDVSGHGRHATFQGEVDVVRVSGKNGGAIDLGKGGSIDLSDHIEALTRGRNFTFAAWVRDAENIVFSFSNGTPRNRVQFELWGNLLVYGWQKGPLFDAVQGRVPGWKPGHWHHVAVMVSGREVTLYLDGEHLVSRSIGHRLSSSTLAPNDLENLTEAYIGLLPSNHDHKPQRLWGVIDDVQFYSRALDEESIQYLFEHPGSVLTDF